MVLNLPQKHNQAFQEDIHMLRLFKRLSFPFSSLFRSGNRRGAGHAVTNILAKELLQEDPKAGVTAKKNRLDNESKKAESSEDTGSLEDLLDDAPLRSS